MRNASLRIIVEQLIELGWDIKTGNDFYNEEHGINDTDNNFRMTFRKELNAPVNPELIIYVHPTHRSMIFCEINDLDTMSDPTTLCNINVLSMTYGKLIKLTNSIDTVLSYR